MNIPSLHLSTVWLCLALLIPGCSEKTDASRAGQVMPEVRYMVVSGEDISLTRELPGRVSAFTVSEVRPQVGGLIKVRLFEEGSDVTEGQVLYEIDPALYQAAYNNAKANLARAQANENASRLLAERYSRLVKTGAVGRQEHDDAQAAYLQTQAEIDAYREALETARINLGYTKVIAPISGRIGRSAVTAGALVTQNQQEPLATVQQISPVYVDVTQPSAQMIKLRRDLASGRLRTGGPDSARVRLYLEDGSPYTAADSVGEGSEPVWIEGDLLFSDITVDQSTGSVSIRVRIDNPDGMLLPGMYVRAVLEEGKLENAVLIPQRSVTRDSRNQPQVQVLVPVAHGEDHTATGGLSPTGPKQTYTVEMRPITIDRVHKNNWLLSSGLAPGDLLLVDGVQTARPGQVVLATQLLPDKKNTALVSNVPGNQMRR